MKITLNLIVFLVGLGLLIAGIWWIYPPASLIVAGMIFMSISLFGRDKT